MIFGIDAIEQSGKYGMPRKHMEIFEQVAQRLNTIIGVRPVSIYAHYFLEHAYPTKPFCAYPTKPFCVKNKTSKKWVTAGLINIVPPQTWTEEEKSKYLSSLKKAFASDKNLKPMRLSLTKERIEELKQFFPDEFNIQEIKTGKGPNYYIFWDKEQKKILGKAIEHQHNHFKIFDQHARPTYVLARKVKMKNGQSRKIPITADYDLLVVCPPYKDFDPGKLDKSPFRTQGIFTHSLQKNLVQIEKANKHPHWPKEDPNLGNVSPRLVDTLNVINESIQSTDLKRSLSQEKLDLATVHHNAEFWNPSPGEWEQQFPCLTAIPPGLHLFPSHPNAHSILVENEDELKQIRQLVIEKGYYWPTHAKFVDQLKPFSEKVVNIISSMVEAVVESKINPNYQA